jgi:hypothetical protein
MGDRFEAIHGVNFPTKGKSPTLCKNQTRKGCGTRPGYLSSPAILSPATTSAERCRMIQNKSWPFESGVPFR